MRRRWSNTKPGVKRWPADQWFSRCIRLASDNTCENCGGFATDCCHIYSRANYTVRWCVLNAISMCRECHNTFGGEPCLWADFIDSRWPGRREQIQAKMRGILKNTPENRALISKHYNAEFRRMEKTGDRNLQSWN